MGLAEKVAESFAPNVFYIANPSSSDILQTPSMREVVAYALRSGRLPSRGKTTFIGSGASAKGYWILGFVTELWNHIEIDNYITSSISNMLVVGEEKGPKVLEELALRIPELLPERDISRGLKIARALMLGYYGKEITGLGKLLHLSEADDFESEEGKLIRNPRGVVTTSKLEDELKRLLGEKTVGESKFMVMVTDYKRECPVALGKEYPELPLYKAIMSAIALQMVIPYQQYKGGLFGDAGPVSYFPLLKELVDKDTKTIIAVDMNYRNGGYKGLPFFLADGAQQAYVRNKHQTRELMKNFTRVSPDELLDVGDYDRQRVAFVAPRIEGILPGTIDIPIEDRLKLIDEGKKAAKAFITRLRQPIWHIPHNFQYAT